MSKIEFVIALSTGNNDINIKGSNIDSLAGYTTLAIKGNKGVR